MCIMYRTCGLLWTAAKTVYCIIHLWCGAHTCNATSHSVITCLERCETASLLTRARRTRHGILHASIRYRTTWRFMKKSDWEPRRAATWALNAWNFHAQGYISLLTRVLDLQASSQLKGFVSGVLVNLNLTHQSRFFFSWCHDCHKYQVDVFIRAPFIHKKGSIKATNY